MEEGYSTNKQPMFRGVTYDYWKEQKITHFKSIHIDLWDVVENGNYITYEDELNEFPRSQWREEQKNIFLLNYKARNIMLCALSEKNKPKYIAS
ncbi:hypothetical protein JHK84_050342 [Glycine max]|nr:hypothetical protein JHK86_050281 [Glycine max]KAG5094754.1 hypothetical protein JHK84_050342 [Glycine max]